MLELFVGHVSVKHRSDELCELLGGPVSSVDGRNKLRELRVGVISGDNRRGELCVVSVGLVVSRGVVQLLESMPSGKLCADLGLDGLRELRGGLLPTKRAELVCDELLGVRVSDCVIARSWIVLIGLSGGHLLDDGLNCVHVLRFGEVSVER